MKKNIIFTIFGVFLASAISVSAYTFTETIRYGTTNSSDVYQLQEKLIAEGYLQGTPNGNVYSTTSAAIKKYQKAKGLYADGIVGAKTRAVLNTGNSNNTQITQTNNNTSITSAPLHLSNLMSTTWQPLCNGNSTTECLSPTTGYSQLPAEAQWLIWAEKGTFDDSVRKILDVKIANCASHTGCVITHTYPETYLCRNSSTYTAGPCA
ncbi:MAG: peptidoglycan-binding domain-containing protein [Minisyncoccia bacterium]